MPRPSLKRPAEAGSSGPTFVAYYRVSTDQQGRSGLGLEAQRAAVARHIASTTGRLVAEFQEIESGKRIDRPQLEAALAACRARRAALVVAKLDRLARNVRFLLSVGEGASEAGIVFCDLPQFPPGPMGKFVITLMAAVAELEAGLISQRTKAALAAVKERGKRLGNPKLRAGDRRAAVAGRLMQSARSKSRATDVLPYIDAARKAGCISLREIAEALTARGVRPPSGGEVWHAAQVRRIEQRRNAS